MKKVECEIYSRIVGYFRPLSNWNPGKQSEFWDRVPIKINTEKPLSCDDRNIEWF